jgi:hypothetical protein
LTKLIGLFATITLALAVLFRFPADYRMSVSIIVSVAAIALAIHCFFIGKFVWGIAFLGVLGIFTPFQIGQFSRALLSILDMASLALFAASPLILKKSTMVVTPVGRL